MPNSPSLAVGRSTNTELPNSAYGEFECTHDCTDITSSSFLNTVGKKTPVLLRISTVGFERGSADTARDIHGWAMKLKTDEGNLDWVFNNTVSPIPSSFLTALPGTYLHDVACFPRPGPAQVPFDEQVAQETPLY